MRYNCNQKFDIIPKNQAISVVSLEVNDNCDQSINKRDCEFSAPPFFKYKMGRTNYLMCCES